MALLLQVRSHHCQGRPVLEAPAPRRPALQSTPSTVYRYPPLPLEDPMVARRLVSLRSLCLLIALAAAPATWAFPVTVDGDPSEWTLPAPADFNTGHIVRSASEQGAFVWTDAIGDERTDFASPDARVDMTEVAITADATNLYVLVRMADLDLETGDGAPQVQLALDLDQLDGSGQVFMANFADTQVPSSAAWEFLVATRFGSGNNDLTVFDAGFNQSQAGAAVASSTDDTIELSVPWSAIGGPPAGPMRFSVASFRANALDGTFNSAGQSNALDVVSNYGAPGSTPNTFTEVQDQIIDYGFEVWFHLDPDTEPLAPALIGEVFYDTPGTDSDEEWIEITNLADVDLDTTGLKVGDAESPGGGEGMQALPSAFVPVGDRFVVAQTAVGFSALYGFNPDAEVSDTDGAVPDTSGSAWATGGIALGNGGDAVLLLDADDTVLDVVTWESGDHPAVFPHPGASSGQSLGRWPEDLDTDDNAVDFLIYGIPTPGDENPAPEDGDAGVFDAGPPPFDAGPPPFDAGPPPFDAGPPALRRRAPALRRRAPALRRRACALRRRAPALRRRACALRRRAPALRCGAPALRRRAPALRRRAPALRRRAPALRWRGYGRRRRRR
jgi:hypothetical protein